MDMIKVKIPWDSENWVEKVQELDKKMQITVHELLNHGVEDLTDYLLGEKGFAESLPRALSEWLNNKDLRPIPTQEDRDWVPAKFVQ